MLELPNFGHMNTSTKKFGLCDKILLLSSLTEIMTSQALFQITSNSRRQGVVNFADIIKIEIMLIKLTYKDSL